jgi:ribosomal protein S18 acetylase RimI-like enzyme
LNVRRRKIQICEFTLDHYDEVLALMMRTPGVSVRDADSREATARYLTRNPGFSFIAQEDGRIIGCAMCGHDGRRGYLQHVIVEPSHRRRGIAHALVTRCLDRLEATGIVKTHIDVFVTNDLANSYWKKRGWKRRDDIYRYSFIRSENQNA